LDFRADDVHAERQLYATVLHVLRKMRAEPVVGEAP
jgi:hypothetical protein